MQTKIEHYNDAKGGLDITPWTGWFVAIVENALTFALAKMENVMHKHAYWHTHHIEMGKDQQMLK